MTAQSFQERIKRIEGRNGRSAAFGDRSSSNSEEERLVIALHLLERNGVQLGASYPWMFRRLARLGFVVRPLHFWSVTGLSAFCFLGMLAIFWTVVFLCQAIGVVPEPIARLVDAPLAVVLALNFGFAVVYALAVRAQAARIELPRWSDI